jgi:hypothetical protein
MTKEKFLTVRWNNLLSLGLGIPALIYVLAAFSNSFWSTRGGLIGLAVIGVRGFGKIQLTTFQSNRGSLTHSP